MRRTSNRFVWIRNPEMFLKVNPSPRKWDFQDDQFPKTKRAPLEITYTGQPTTTFSKNTELRPLAKNMKAVPPPESAPNKRACQ